MKKNLRREVLHFLSVQVQSGFGDQLTVFEMFCPPCEFSVNFQSMGGGANAEIVHSGGFVEKKNKK
jgi:hypothetical protein